MGLSSEWEIDQCFDCGKLAIFCKEACRKEYITKHTKKCKKEYYEVNKQREKTFVNLSGFRTERENQAVDFLVNKERKKCENA